MNKKKIGFFIALGVVLAAAVTATLILGNVPEKEVKPEMKVSEEYKREDIDDVIEEMRGLASEMNISASETVIDSNIVNAKSEEEADEMVFYFIQQTDVYPYMNSSHQDLIEHLRKNKVKPKELDAFFAKEKAEHFKKSYEAISEAMIEFELGVGESYIGENYLTQIRPAYGVFLLKYEDFISDEFKDYLQMKNLATMNYKATLTGGFDPDTLSEGLTAIDEYLEKRADSKYAKTVKREQVFPYQNYFGYYPGSKVFNEYDLSVAPEMMKHYEEKAKLDTTLGKKAGKMVEALKKSDGIMTAEVLGTIEEITETSDANFYYYWHGILGIETEFDEANAEEVIREETITDPDTGEVIDIVRYP